MGSDAWFSWFSTFVARVLVMVGCRGAHGRGGAGAQRCGLLGVRTVACFSRGSAWESGWLCARLQAGYRLFPGQGRCERRAELLDSLSRQLQGCHRQGALPGRQPADVCAGAVRYADTEAARRPVRSWGCAGADPVGVCRVDHASPGDCWHRRGERSPRSWQW